MTDRTCGPEQFADDILRLEPPVSNPLTPHLLVDPEDDRGLCHEFLNEAVSRFSEDETVKEALVGAIEELSRQLSKMTMNDNYKPYVLVSAARPPFSWGLRVVLRVSRRCAILSNTPHW